MEYRAVSKPTLSPEERARLDQEIRKLSQQGLSVTISGRLTTDLGRVFADSSQASLGRRLLRDGAKRWRQAS